MELEADFEPLGFDSDPSGVGTLVPGFGRGFLLAGLPSPSELFSWS